MLNRRAVLAAGAASLLGGAPSFGSATSPDTSLARLLDAHADWLLQRYPEEATELQWDVGPHAGLRSRLGDRSRAAQAEDRATLRRFAAELARIDRAALSFDAGLDFDVAAFVYATLDDGFGRYGAVDLDLRPTPYVVSQMNGAYYWLRGLLGETHPLASAADVAAWHARLAALAVRLDEETDRIRYDASAGIVPPDFVLRQSVSQIRTLCATPALESPLLAPAAARAGDVLRDQLVGRGIATFEQAVVPALARQADALEALLPVASDVAGVWRLPDGAGYYEAALRANATVTAAPADLHRAGREQCAALLAAIDAGLRRQGLASGSVGARLAALNRDPRFLVGEDDAGRARILAEGRRVLDEVARLLPRAFAHPVRDALTVQRLSRAAEDASPLAFYEAGIGGRPGAVRLNLKRTQDLPLWRLATILHHEGVPGHHFQAATLRHSHDLGRFRKLVRFSAYTEGYGLYAQQVADEIGAFDTHPVARIGYLQSELFRAARIVVDTGIHAMRWTREQAVAWMVDEIGEVRSASEREVARYCVFPGQACSFKVGADAIVRAREAARRRLGGAFDVRRFHDLVLQSGPMPMTVLEAAAARMR